MSGRVYGVSVGAGDPEQMTLQAVRILRECDIIAIPASDRVKCFAFRIAEKAVPEIVQKPVLPLPLPMTHDKYEREAAYKEATFALKKATDEGKTVAFITIGDVSVYSTYLYLHERLLASGVNTYLVPGVTSFCAAAAQLGEGLCRDDDELHVIPGIHGADEACSLSGTKVFMKGNIAEIKAQLKASNHIACAVEKCGTDEQVVYNNTDEIPDDAGYFTVIIAKEIKA